MTTYWERLASRLPAGGSAALVTSPHNRRYLTGFPSSDGCVLILPDAAYFLTDFRYIEAARRQIRSMECLCYQRLTDTLRELTEKHGVRRLLVEAGQMTLRERRKLRETLSGDVEDGDELDDWLEALRLIKSPDELRRIREAQALTAYGFEKILDYIRPGRTEREIALELEFLIRRQGAEGIAFDFIVVSGANSSLPHGVPSDKAVEPGDFVTMDFGARVRGYCSDMTRTVAVGKISDEQKRVYDSVLEAHLRAMEAIRPGAVGRDVDEVARGYLRSCGYEFGHSLGHGVGLDIHEEPRLSTRSDDVLEPGNVVTDEPGVYLPGKCGCRIEDSVLVTKDGCRSLIPAAKELITL